MKIRYKWNREGGRIIEGEEVSPEWQEYIVPAYKIPEYWVQEYRDGEWSNWIGTNRSPAVRMANGEII